jgi:hypothetical protein
LWWSPLFWTTQPRCGGRDFIHRNQCDKTFLKKNLKSCLQRNPISPLPSPTDSYTSRPDHHRLEEMQPREVCKNRYAT